VKVLHLDGVNEDFGGVLSVLRNLSSASAGPGWRHVVWVNEKYLERRQPPLDYRRSPHSVSDSPSHLRILFQAFRAYGDLKRLLAAETFDVVHAHSRGAMLVAMLLASLAGRRVIFTNHNYARNRALYRRVAKMKGVWTVLLTPNMSRYYGIPVDPPHISIISSCYADKFLNEPLVVRSGDSVAKRPVRLVGVGTILRWKNWHLIAEAMSRLTGEDLALVQFTLVGPTPDSPESRQYERELRELIRRHQLETRFILRGPAGSVVDELRQADWMVHPSSNEPCGLALLEAMAVGLPVITSRSGGPVDFVQPERTGVFFEPDDADSLAVQLRRILSRQIHPLPPAEIRETVRDRSASGVWPQYEKLYRRLVDTDCLSNDT